MKAAVAVRSVAIACLAVVGQALHAGAAPRSIFDEHFRNEPFQFDPPEETPAMSSNSAQAPMRQIMRLQAKLLSLSDYYSALDYVPYIWGGGNIGSKEACFECRKCALQKRAGLKSRLSRCRACQSCGIDCSHFVNMLYNRAGLDYPYASTAELKRVRPEEIASRYNLLDMGKNIRVVQPGDLLVYRNHVVMALALTSSGRGDFIHATRFGDRRQTGGIKLERDRSLGNYRGKLVRILRHRRFFEALSPLLGDGSRRLQLLDSLNPYAAQFLGPLGPTRGFIQR